MRIGTRGFGVTGASVTGPNPRTPNRLFLSLLLSVCMTLAAIRAAGAADPGRGAVLFALAAGCGCHTAAEGPVGAGGRAIATPFGTFYGTNITPDRETGIGAWTDAEIIAAIREGVARDRIEAPVMPYAAYAGMADGDVADLVAYLRTLPAVRRANRPAEVKLPVPALAYRAWRWWYAPRMRPPAAAPSEDLARGRYLVDHVAICPDCHTPRTRLGALDGGMYLAGVDAGAHTKSVPNITPDDATGIGEWSERNLVELLQRGTTPDMDTVQGPMAEVIDGVGGGPGYSRAPESELRSIAKYLKTVPPVHHEVASDE
jgi:mono/diheme cytochrome c family protein